MRRPAGFAFPVKCLAPILVACLAACDAEPPDAAGTSERAGASEQTAPRDDRPHVVVVVLDTTRADLLSAYGHEVRTSPNLDGLAREGALFTRAYSTDFWTLPAHASLFTGRYPSEHGATSESNHFPDLAPTLAGSLAASGYRTAAFVANPWLSRANGFDRGFQRFEESWRGKKPEGHHDRDCVESASRFIRTQARAGRPFFLFVNINLPHLPYRPSTEALHAVAPRPRSIERVRAARDVVGMWEYLGGAFALDDEDFAILRDLYRGELRSADELLGTLVEALRAAEILDDTLVIVTSDHGENIGERGMIDHLLSMYETTLRIPLVIRYPERFEAGAVRDDLVSLVDIAPTVLEVAGVEGVETSGRSLLDPEAAAPGFVVAENERPLNAIELMASNYPDFDTASVDGPMRTLLTDRYKLIWKETRGVELYDLVDDPEELRDLQAAKPELRDELLRELQAWRAARADRVPAPPAPAPQLGEAAEQLRALGYLE